MTVEILQVADQVAREKGIDRQVVIEAMETAIQTASRKKYGANKNIQVRFDSKSGDFQLHQLREVVSQDDEETIWDADNHITLNDARNMNPEAQVGDFIAEQLPSIEFGRIAAQTAKQVIVQKVRDAERERIFEEYIDRQGQLVNGLVKRVERNNIHVDLGRTSAFLPHEEQLPREHYRPGDRIRAYIKEVRDVTRGPQIILSRTHPQLVLRLFEMEVPEIYDGIVEIKAVARDAGHRSKIAVRSSDAHVDPVGACVGMRGSRVQGVVTELQGERIDIIEWSSDAAVFICNALAPAEVIKVVVDEDEENIKVVVDEQQLSLAIGRRGQNVRLASELTGWRIDIITEQEERNMREEMFGEIQQTFMAELDLGEAVASALVGEGFTSSEEVAYVPLDELASIEGFDEDIAQELRNRARDQLLQQAMQTEERKAELHIDPNLTKMDMLTDDALIALAEKGIGTLDDLADLASDELVEVFDGEIALKDAETLIIEARRAAGWFDDEEQKVSEEG
uniref:Transcription termination/antitermination protein NusA n=1 Tax=Magnetococcus massalia (strain MO-1) TaxID=451514 RepID=A0A1S7LNN8_MAGMO|nr:Transcription elongation protein nusA (N utilization substance protein A) (L factor) [Candidatus Magnetococcus massalia]